MNKIARYLLEIKAVQLNLNAKFIWSSGIQSPIYTDNRLIISYPKIREFIEVKFANMIKKQFPELTMVVGTSTAGIPHAAYVSNILGLPMGYVRGSNKEYGKKNQIEGFVAPDSKIVVIEDLLSTGKSSLEVFRILKSKGYNVLGIASIFSYNLIKLKKNFRNIKYFSLITLDELLSEAKELEYLSDKEIEKIKIFINNL